MVTLLFFSLFYNLSNINVINIKKIPKKGEIILKYYN